MEKIQTEQPDGWLFIFCPSDIHCGIIYMKKGVPHEGKSQKIAVAAKTSLGTG